MSTSNYMLITVASADSAHVGGVLEKVGRLATALREDAGAVSTRYGVVVTGDLTGNLVLFQGYEELNGIDRAFDVYAKAEVYREIVSTPSLKIVLRNLWKLEDIGLASTSSEPPAYGVVTRFGSADLMMDRMREALPIFEENGAMVVRYGTLITGSNVGRRLLGVGYPSMDSIEKTYRALGASEVYKDFLANAELDWRNIVRFEG